jgi:uncharacterized protein YdgA (DUF945 family)
MKKITIAALLLILIFVVAPWGIGQLAEQRVNAGLDRIVAQAPYLTIAERKWTRGWFRSEQQVTFEVSGAWVMHVLHPGATSSEPVHFTVRNEILHGPVLWPASLGIARINTRLELDAKTRQQIVDIFGSDDPVRMSTRVGFFGGGTTRLSGEGRTIKARDSKGSLKYDDYQLDVSYSGDLDEIDLNGSWPSLEIFPAEGGSVLVDHVTLTSSNERILHDLYDTDLRLRVDKVQVIGLDKSETLVEDVHYLIDTKVEKDFVDLGAKLGSGKVRSQELNEMKLELDEVHYDFTLRRLHTETLGALSTALKQMYAPPVATAADAEATWATPLRKYGAELLKYDPEFVIDRIGVATPEGDGYIKGVLRLKGATAEDLQVGFMALVAKLEADIHIDVAQKLIEKIPSGATSAGAAIDAGYAKRDGDKLVSHIEFRQGELKVNGKAQGIPGLGRPPAAAGGMPPQGEVPAGPQE